MPHHLWCTIQWLTDDSVRDQLFKLKQPGVMSIDASVFMNRFAAAEINAPNAIDGVSRNCYPMCENGNKRTDAMAWMHLRQKALIVGLCCAAMAGVELLQLLQTFVTHRSKGDMHHLRSGLCRKVARPNPARWGSQPDSTGSYSMFPDHIATTADSCRSKPTCAHQQTAGT